MDTAIYREDSEGNEVEIEVEVEGDCVPFKRGRTYGPPEDCYEDEGGFAENVAAFVMDGKVRREVPITKEEADEFNEMLMETALDAAEAAYESAMEARAEALAEREYD